MHRGLVRLPLLPHFAFIGFILGVGTGQWAATTAAGETAPIAAPSTSPAPASVSPVLVSVSSFDLSRLVPSQFGDWDAAPSLPTR